MLRLPLVSAAVALTLTACAVEEREGPGSSTQRLDIENGDHLNGDHLNGDHLNGDHLNTSGLGWHVASIAYGSLEIDGKLTDEAWIDGSELRARRVVHFHTGTDLTGANLAGTSDTGERVRLKIKAVQRDAAPNGDTWLYTVQFRDPTVNEWKALCGHASGAPVPAIAVAGRWDYRQGVPGGGAKIDDPSAFTFACKGRGAIGKCISPIGYAPWRSASGVELDRHHQACVRLIRADFCGDGTPYTVPGSRVNVYDAVGVQQDDRDWLIEAEWDEGGARCFNVLNRSHELAPCFPMRATTACGTFVSFSLGALLMNETPIESNLPP